jgi:hypothetical protein
MELGTTFLPNVGGSHFWVIISDPKKDPDNVLIVSLTTDRQDKDHSCVLDRGDHPMVTHRTCVDYRRARIVRLAELYAGKDSGAFLLKDPASPAMVRAIQEGAARSDFLKEAARNLLVQQGFIASLPPG